MSKSITFPFNFILLILLLIIMLLNCVDTLNTDQTPPVNPPQIITIKANADSAFITLTWDSVKDADSYNLYWNTQAGITDKSTKLENVSSPYKHKNLPLGKTYYYKINAENKAGPSALSDEKAIPLKKKLQTPTGVTANPDNQKITITWNSVLEANSYTIYWSTTPNVSLNSDFIPGVTSPFEHNNLTNGVAYYYRVRAISSNDSSDLSSEVIAMPNIITLPPPTNVIGKSGNGIAIINWDVIANHTYNIYWNTQGNVTTADNKFARVNPPYTHSGLINNTTYYYKVSATNANGIESELSSEINVIPQGDLLLPPTGVSAIGEDSKVTISWSAVNNADSYKVYWDTVPNISKMSDNFSSITTTFLHESLSNGTTYYYRVSAINSTNESELSEEVYATPSNITVPPPENVRVVPGNEQLAVMWDAVPNTSYKIYWAKKPNITKINSNIITDATSPFVHLSLINDSSYYYRVTALRDAVESELSIEVTAIPSDSIPPEPPTNVTAVPGDSKVEVSWDPSVTATSYNIYWANQPNVSMNSSKQIDVSNPFEHLNLTNGTKYYYRITSVNNIGESELSNEVFATPEDVPNPPQPPEEIEVTPGNKNVNIAWDDVINATTYNIYWANEANITTTNSTKIEDVLSPFEHQDLTNGKEYYYRLSAENSAGESDLSDEFNAIPFTNTPPPKKPVNVSATGQNKIIKLNWDNVTNAPFYNIYWATTPNVTTNSTKIEDVKVSKYEHKNLTNGTTYYYRISARNDGGESELSDEVYAKPYDPDLPPLPPTNITATGGHKRIDLSWDSVPNAYSYNIYWGLDNTTPNKQDKIFLNSYMHQKLKPKTTYYYRISAVKKNGEEGEKSKLIEAKTN